MGTTLTVLSFMPSEGVRLIAHVGDSRAYLLRDDRLTQITTDHTWVQRQVELGKLTPSRARVHPYSSVLTHALGSDDDRIDALEADARPGDLYLLCSDGLTAVLEDEAIAELLQPDAALATSAERLIEAANEGGGPDNITVVLVRVV